MSAAEQVREEMRRLLFHPYNQNGANRGQSAGNGRSAQKKKGSKRTWLGQFVWLADQHACRPPSSAEKQVLQQAVLGLKLIPFFVNDSEVEVKEKLTSDILDDNGEPMDLSATKGNQGV